MLKSNEHARIINVASAAHYNVVDKFSKEKTNRTFIESLLFKTHFNTEDLQAKCHLMQRLSKLDQRSSLLKKEK